MAIINQLAYDEDADDSLSPLATTNNNHCNNQLQQQTTPLPFSMNHGTGNTHPIVHHPSSDATLHMNTSISISLIGIRRQRVTLPAVLFCFVKYILKK